MGELLSVEGGGEVEVGEDFVVDGFFLDFYCFEELVGDL